MARELKPNLSGVAETLLITLYVRALESRRPDAILRDEKAVAAVEKLDYDFSRFERLKMDEKDRLTIVLRSLEFDRRARDFLARNPESVIVHIGCGLDARFDRVDNGRVEWYDLDLPAVIDLRREIVGGETARHHFLPHSAFEGAWLERLEAHRGKPMLFLAEGVFMYFEKAAVRSLVLALRDRFPGAELVFDMFAPIINRVNNLRFKLSATKFHTRYYWGMTNGKDLEKWAEGIRFLGRWGIFDRPEPRLGLPRWMRHIPLFANIIGVFHYRLGPARSAKERKAGQ